MAPGVEEKHCIHIQVTTVSTFCWHPLTLPYPLPTCAKAQTYLGWSWWAPLGQPTTGMQNDQNNAQYQKGMGSYPVWNISTNINLRECINHSWRKHSAIWILIIGWQWCQNKPTWMVHGSDEAGEGSVGGRIQRQESENSGRNKSVKLTLVVLGHLSIELRQQVSEQSLPQSFSTPERGKSHVDSQFPSCPMTLLWRSRSGRRG